MFDSNMTYGPCTDLLLGDHVWFVAMYLVSQDPGRQAAHHSVQGPLLRPAVDDGVFVSAPIRVDHARYVYRTSQVPVLQTPTLIAASAVRFLWSKRDPVPLQRGDDPRTTT